MAAHNTKMAPNNKVKGLLKGLRYISQIFEDEEPEMQIGAPTDVKHVAHIGVDGQSENSSAPSWMSDFNSPANGSKATEEKPAKSVSQGTNVNNGQGDSASSKEKKDKGSHIRKSASRRDHKTSQSSSFSDMPNGDGPKSSKRDKPKKSKKSSSSSSSKNSTCSETSSKPKKIPKDPSIQATESNSTSEDLTKKSDRRKKSKDVGLSKAEADP